MSDQTTSGPVLAADGTPLKRSLARALRLQKLRALALVAPLLLFVLITFIAPIADMLFRSVENQIVSETLPQTVSALADWDPDSGEIPGEPVFRALAADLKVAVEAKSHTKLGSRLNYEMTGASSLFRKTGRKVKRMEIEGETSLKDEFVAIDKDWGETPIWKTIKTYSPSYTNGYFLNAVDMQKGPDGPEARPENQQIYMILFGRTLFMSVVITMSCIVLGYPVAWILANLPTRTSNLLMILVLLPFWTSLLVRTSAWKVMLQQQGVINDTLVWLGLVADDARLVMINNQFGTIVAMTHILLPFMILPMYSVMQTIQPTYLRAAKSMGATNWTAFWRVYFPQSVPGIGAGSILVFILSIGYYITPEIVGGNTGTFISNRIAYHISSSLNWGLAAALGAILLAVVLLLYYAYDKIVGIDNVKLGG
ncbi:ABC transporter permease [Sedimentitalea todarodis]|uniref:ABC transporter permease n=1 Tax=Sedimentitalea todarodis TaxID=1631240 RepID=A0ABU3VDJ6_9RHOB|nr:ABC transporter permease [Sedimentitalea todarodis]MDU9004232.1 ABC transporter permease [Sedimentitalea todarodis]